MKDIKNTVGAPIAGISAGVGAAALGFAIADLGGAIILGLAVGLVMFFAVRAS